MAVMEGSVLQTQSSCRSLDFVTPFNGTPQDSDPLTCLVY